jgi:hypothetical protein
MSVQGIARRVFFEYANILNLSENAADAFHNHINAMLQVFIACVLRTHSAMGCQGDEPPIV